MEKVPGLSRILKNIETFVRRKLQCFPFSVKIFVTETSLKERCIIFLICQDRKHFYGELKVVIVKALLFRISPGTVAESLHSLAALLVKCYDL